MLLRFELKLGRVASEWVGFSTAAQGVWAWALPWPFSPEGSQFPNFLMTFQRHSLPIWSFNTGNSRLGESADCQSCRACAPSCPEQGCCSSRLSVATPPRGASAPLFLSPALRCSPGHTCDPGTQAGSAPGGIASGR